jgi:hypothetical protein
MDPHPTNAMRLRFGRKSLPPSPDTSGTNHPVHLGNKKMKRSKEKKKS